MIGPNQYPRLLPKIISASASTGFAMALLAAELLILAWVTVLR
jgi:hypothetical protein